MCVPQQTGTYETLLAADEAEAAAGSEGEDGPAAFGTLTNHALAYIEDGATVKANHDSTVAATNNALAINLTGGLAVGATAGAGAPAGFNIIDGTARAGWGDTSRATGRPGSRRAGPDAHPSPTSNRAR